MSKQSVYLAELEKLKEIFQNIEEDKAKLVEGLVEDAAFLLAENNALREIIGATGMVKIHPQYPEMQKSTEASKQYLKNVNAYAVVIKTLNGVLNRSIVDQDDDELDEFE